MRYNMSGLKKRILARVFTRYPSLAERASRKVVPLNIRDVPWTPLIRPLENSNVALVTTAGVHMRGQRGFDMEDPDGDPTFRAIPGDAPSSELAITHDYYDHSDADRDTNIVFPTERLRELAAEGLIGGVAENHYGFMGHIKGAHLETLVNETAPQVAGMLKKEGVGAVVLTPG